MEPYHGILTGNTCLLSHTGTFSFENEARTRYGIIFVMYAHLCYFKMKPVLYFTEQKFPLSLPNADKCVSAGKTSCAHLLVLTSAVILDTYHTAKAAPELVPWFRKKTTCNCSSLNKQLMSQKRPNVKSRWNLCKSSKSRAHRPSGHANEYHQKKRGEVKSCYCACSSSTSCPQSKECC